MAVTRWWVRGFRSLRAVELELGRVTVVHGANGTGKTNLYRSLVVLARAADGRLARAVLEEGGLPSLAWAGAAATGREAKHPLRVVVGVELDGPRGGALPGIRRRHRRGRRGRLALTREIAGPRRRPRR